MAELKASEVKYGIPLKTSVGGLFLTATQIEFPASAESITGGVELNLAKLGLTDEAVAGISNASGEVGAGEIASTSGATVFAWSTTVVEQTTAAKGEAIVKAVPTVITTEEKGKKLFLRFLAVVTLKKVWLELTTAEKANATVGVCGCTVFCLGK
jgi:hypothetical protein